MQIAILGPVQVGSDGRVIDLPGMRIRRLLTRLAVDAGRVVSADELTRAVWPDDPPGNVTNALQTLVSRLRRALGSNESVRQEFRGYRLAVAPEAVDVTQFVDAARRGRQALDEGRLDEAAQLLDAALGLWRGDPLEDAGDAEYVGPLVTRWEQQQLDATADRIEVDLARGAGRPRVADLQALVVAHPLQERFTSLLLRALAAEGRTAEALSAYERLRNQLAEELGADPSPTLQDQHLELLRHTPPAPAPARSATNVPTPVTRFIGRGDEVSRVLHLLDSARLVSIVGPGGAGKTRLATEIAARSQPQYRDGVWLVELAPVSEESGVVRALSEPLGRYDGHVLDPNAERPSLDPVERLVERLSPMQTLLVVDNCEHVVDWTASLVDTLLAACPDLHVLTTSREPLGIAGEALCVLTPLAMPAAGSTAEEAALEPSVQLFLERAESVDATFVLDNTTVAGVVEIVRRLDGLPLAIELAAARLRTLPVKEVASRLTDRFRLLTGGSRTAMPRHRTLRAVVDWSWSLLTPQERLLAERLSVFPSGATPKSAESICTDARLPAGLIPELLDSLVEKSLLKVSDEAGLRYRMLETIREYGVERLADRGEVEAARLAHARHFANLVAVLEPKLRGADQLEALHTLDLERDNILSALRFLVDSGDADAAVALAASLCWYWTMVGTPGEAVAWLQFALGVPGGSDRRTRLVLETVLTMSLLASGSDSQVGDWNAARIRMAELDDALDAFTFTEPTLIVMRPMVAHFAERRERAAKLTELALASEDQWTRAAVRTIRANIAENDGDVEAMRADLDASVEDLLAVGDRWLLGSNLSARSRIHTLDGRLDDAIAALTQAVSALREVGSLDDQAYVGLRLVELHTRMGDLAAARRQLTASFGDTSSWPPAELFETALTLGIARAEGDVAAAERLQIQLRGQVATMSGSHPVDAHARAIMLGVIADHDIWRGRLSEAATEVSEAYQTALETRDMPIVATVGVVVAALTASSGDPHTAAVLLGGAAVLRGAADETDPAVRRLTTSLRADLGDRFQPAYDEGRALTKTEALARLDPSALALSVTATG